MTNNNNTNNNKIFGETIMLDFDNGIFSTENETLKSGRVICWVIEVSTGERMFFVDNQSDLDQCISDCMHTRLGI